MMTDNLTDDPTGIPIKKKISETGFIKNNTETSHILDKGPCIKCGIYDHFVCYSKDFGKTWMHYRCKDE